MFNTYQCIEYILIFVVNSNNDKRNITFSTLSHVDPFTNNFKFSVLLYVFNILDTSVSGGRVDDPSKHIGQPLFFK